MTRNNTTVTTIMQDTMRETVSKVAIGVSVLFAADNIFMVWALLYGGYGGWIYIFISLIPLFLPATLASIALTGIYVHGVRRRSWTLRRADRIFFVLFAVSLTIKVVGQVLWGGHQVTEHP
jgi:hypothetical protein